MKISMIALLMAMAAGPALADEAIPRVLTADEQTPGEICAPADAVKATLEQKGLVPVAIMRTESGTAVTLMASEDGHWVIGELIPNGPTLMSCYRGSGDTFTIELPRHPPSRES